VEAYLETQGHRLLSLDRTEIAAIQEEVDRRWRTLVDRCRAA
jgi:hypothetical protein